MVMAIPQVCLDSHAVVRLRLSAYEMLIKKRGAYRYCKICLRPIRIWLEKNINQYEIANSVVLHMECDCGYMYHLMAVKGIRAWGYFADNEWIRAADRRFRVFARWWRRVWWMGDAHISRVRLRYPGIKLPKNVIRCGNFIKRNWYNEQ